MSDETPLVKRMALLPRCETSLHRFSVIPETKFDYVWKTHFELRQLTLICVNDSQATQSQGANQPEKGAHLVSMECTCRGTQMRVRAQVRNLRDNSPAGLYHVRGSSTTIRSRLASHERLWMGGILQDPSKDSFGLPEVACFHQSRRWYWALVRDIPPIDKLHSGGRVWGERDCQLEKGAWTSHGNIRHRWRNHNVVYPKIGCPTCSRW